MLGSTWDEADARLNGYFADKLPPELEGQADVSSYEETLPDGTVRHVALRITQAVHVRQRAFTCGTVFTHNPAFEKTLRASLPKRFPAGGSWAQERLSRFDWTLTRAA